MWRNELPSFGVSKFFYFNYQIGFLENQLFKRDYP